MSVENPLDNVDFNVELANIPFDHMIGGALNAVLDAQVQSATTTINFIQSVGFHRNSDDPESFGEPVMIEFWYSQPSKLFGMGEIKHHVKVPFLALIPIPMLRISYFRLSFSAEFSQVRDTNINSQFSTISTFAKEENDEDNTTTDDRTETAGESYTETTKDYSGDRPTSTTSDVKTGFREGLLRNDEWNITSTFSGFMSEQAWNNDGNKITKNYSIKVLIEAGEDSMPGGLEKILDILTSNVKQMDEGSAHENMMQDVVSDAVKNSGQQDAPPPDMQ